MSDVGWKKVIAVDIDGVLIDYPDCFIKYVHEVFGNKLPKNTPDFYPPDFMGSVRDLFGVDEATYQALKDAYRNSGIKKMIPPKNGVPDFLRQIEEKGYDIWLCTSRPKFCGPDTLQWIKNYNISYSGLIIDKGDKYGSLVEKLGKNKVYAAIDDNPDYIARLKSLDIQMILMMNDMNAKAIEEDILPIDPHNIATSFHTALLKLPERVEVEGTPLEFRFRADNSNKTEVLTPPHEQAARIAELQKEWLQLYFKKAADYGEGANHLGLAGQYAEIYRKMKKLEKAMWCGEPLFNEQLDEVLMDLIGHAFLSIDFIRNGDPGLKKGQS